MTARRWARGWELHIDGEGVTQSRSLTDAEYMVRDYIALMHGVPADSFGVEITPVMGGDLDEAIRAAVVVDDGLGLGLGGRGLAARTLWPRPAEREAG